MAKEIVASCKVTIGSGTDKVAGDNSLSEDLEGTCVGFNFTVSNTAAVAISLTGIVTPKVVFIENKDDTNPVTFDNVITLDNWPQTLLPGAGVLLRPSTGTLFGKATAAPVKVWIVAG
jgi:hypothetical protein